MTAREMFFEIEDTEKYEEDRNFIKIYSKDCKEPYLTFDKCQKKVIIESLITIGVEELKAINQQVKELNWDNE